MVILQTPRLRLRVAREADAATMAAYRSDPEVAKYQDWDMPYTLERAVAGAAKQAEFDDVVEGSSVSFAIELDGDVIGDIVACVRDGGGIAEMGYTLAPRHQGHGYATEAANAMVDHLLQHGVHRIEASLDPENIASMRVLEVVGMRMECLARDAYLVRGEWVDDLRYSLVAQDRAAWLQRPRTPAGKVELVEITPEDAYLWGRLQTHHSQERFVSPMARSFRDALFPEMYEGGAMVPWMRGILADGERVGFMMLGMVTEHHPEPYLWRLLIDRLQQRRGLGTHVLAVLCDQLRLWGHPTLTTSWSQGPGSPEPFYLSHGFVPTGEMDDDEVIGRLQL
ncbi:MAG: GNAT family N-acetyltransferase [Ilumatobacteraceae bacterium]|nr:GNAT family N-acetyltransferase [Ilumatobacteraceae bacterium]